jgi:class 3 adenylate cyclase
MASGYHKNMDQADEVIEIPRAHSRIVNLGGTTVSFDDHEPGWRWSEHVKPLVGTELCESRHIGYVISGRLGIRLQDGTEFVCEPGDVVDIPPGHDGWVVGGEPLRSITWVGGATWLAPLNALKERVLVTLLFTDIVDSTATAQALGERRWAELLTTHDQRMTDAVDRYRGHIAKFTGDGILAIFDGAARAIRCGLHCRTSARELGLDLRIGVHTGEIESVGDEIHGLAVHEASRIMTHAAPGEILVSEMTRMFARDDQLEFEERREVELRGVDGTVRVYRVRTDE